MPAIATPLANRKPGDIDFVVVGENTEGEYWSVGGRIWEGTEREVVHQQSVFSRTGTVRIMKFAFDLVRARPRNRVTSATKSNGISITIPYWDQRFKAMAAQYPDIAVDQYHIDILCAHFVRRPRSAACPRPGSPARPRRPLNTRPRRGREKPHAHRQDHDHCVVHLVDANLAGNRKQQRSEQHDRRDAFQHAAENDEDNEGYGHESGRGARQAGHRTGQKTSVAVATPRTAAARTHDRGAGAGAAICHS